MRKELRVVIAGDAKGAIKAFEETQASATGAGSKIGSAVAKIAMAGVGVGVAAAAIAVKSASTYEKVGKEVLKLQRYTGLGAEQTSRLRVAFQLTGIDSDKAAKALGLFSKAIAGGKLDGLKTGLDGTTGSAKDTGKAIVALATAQRKLVEIEAIDHGKKKLTIADQLHLRDAIQAVSDAQSRIKGLTSTSSQKISEFGIATRDSHGKLLPMHDLLLKVADKLSKMPAGWQKNNAVMKLFGKSGADLLPFLNKGAAGIAELEKQSDKFGTTLSGKDLAAVKESTKQHRLFTLGMQGLQIQIGRYVLPVITKLVGFFAAHLPAAIKVTTKIVTAIRTAFKVVFDYLKVGFAVAKASFEGWQDGLNSHGWVKVVAEIAAGGRKVVDFFVRNWPMISRVIGDVISFIERNWKAIALVLGGPLALVIGAIIKFRTQVGEAAQWIIAKFGEVVAWTHKHWSAIKEIIGIAVAAVRNVISAVVATIGFMWDHFGARIIQTAKIAWDLIVGVVQGAINVVAGIVRTVMDIIHGKWGNVWHDISQIVSGVWEIIKSIVGAAIASVWNTIQEVGIAIGIAWSAIWSGIESVAGSIWDGVVSAIKSGINLVIKALDGMISAVNSILSHLPGNLSIPTIQLLNAGGAVSYTPNAGSGPLLHRAAAGGRVPGVGDRDTVPALLTPGEFVMRKSAVKAIGADRLHAMNRGGQGGMGADGWHRYSFGGMVGGWLSSAGDWVSKVAAAAADSVWEPIASGVRGVERKIPLGKGILRNLADGGTDKVLDGITSLIKGEDTIQGTINNAKISTLGPAIAAPYTGGSALLNRVLWTIRQTESVQNYLARNPTSTASGAYQFLDTTWAGYGGFPRAYLAPPSVQDAKAGGWAQQILGQFPTHIEAVPITWYTGSYYPGMPLGTAADGGSISAYVRKWQGNFDSTGPQVYGFNKGGMVHGRSFDAGGALMPGWNAVRNDTGGVEHLVPRGQGGITVNVTVQGSVLTPDQLGEAVADGVRNALLKKKHLVGSLGLA